jgi:hypothetical protein
MFMFPSAKTIVKRLILRDFTVSVDAIASILKKKGVDLSWMAIAGIRREFRDDLRFLDSEGLLREGLLDPSSLPRGKYAKPNTPRRRRSRRSLTPPEPDNSIDWGTWRRRR